MVGNVIALSLCVLAFCLHWVQGNLVWSLVTGGLALANLVVILLMLEY